MPILRPIFHILHKDLNKSSIDFYINKIKEEPYTIGLLLRDVRFGAETFISFFEDLPTGVFQKLIISNIMQRQGHNLIPIFSLESNFDAFIKFIANNPLLKLDLRGIILTAEQYKRLGIVLSKTKIKVLAISNTNITDVALSNLLGELNPSTITTLDLVHTGLLPNCGRIIADFVRGNDRIKHLTLRNNFLSSGAIHILLSIPSSSVIVLCLSNNRVATDVITALCNSKKLLTKIFLGRNNLNDDDIIKLINWLHTQSKLVTLGLNGNQITDLGLRYLGAALSFNQTIRNLFLQQNNLITFAELETFAAFLKMRRQKFSMLFLPSVQPNPLPAYLQQDGLNHQMNTLERYIQGNYEKEENATADSILVMYAIMKARINPPNPRPEINDLPVDLARPEINDLPVDLVRMLRRFLY